MALGLNQTSYSVTFTATDSQSTGSYELTYQIRTASGGGGSLLTSGTFTSGANVTTATFSDPTLVNGNNTRYLRVRDGANNWAEQSFTVEAYIIDAKSGSDTLTVTATEGVSNTFSPTGSDAGDFSSSDSEALNIRPGDGADLQVTESASIFRALSDSDTGDVTLPGEVGGFFQGLPGQADSGSVSAAENADVLKGWSVADSGAISATEGTSLTVAATATDSPVVVLQEGISTEATLAGADSSNITVAEAGIQANPKTSSDTGAFQTNETQAQTLVEYFVAESPLDLVVYPNNRHIDDALSGKFGSREEHFRMYRVTRQGEVLEDISHKVLSGTIEATCLNSVARTGRFQFDSLDGIDVKTDHLLVVYVLTINGIEVEFKQGIFYLNAPTWTHTEKLSSGEAVAQDLAVHLIDELPYPLTIPAGTNYGEAIRTIAALKGATQISITPTSHVLPNDMPFNPGTPYLAAMNQLLEGINYTPAWYCKGAMMHCHPRLFLHEQTPDAVYTTDEDGTTRIIIEPFAGDTTQTDLKNQVVVQVNDPLREAFWETYYIENQASPVAIPMDLGVEGFSATDYFEATSAVAPASSILNPGKIHDALPAFPSNTYPLQGAVSFGGWVWLDVSRTDDQVIGGMWSSSAQKSFLLMASAAAGSYGPVFKVSGDGSSEVSVQAPLPAASGMYHVMGVFNPGGAMSDNLVANPGFETGLQAPGSSWTAEQDVTHATPSWMTSGQGDGTRSLTVTYTPIASGQEYRLTQKYTSGFKVGRPLEVSVKRYFASRTHASQDVRLTVWAHGADNSVLETVHDVTWSSLDGAWATYTALSDENIPAGTAYLIMSIRHQSNSGTGAMVCHWDTVSVTEALKGELKIHVKKYGDDYETTTVVTAGLPSEIYEGTSVFRLGYTGHGGAAFGGVLDDMALYYGAVTEADVAYLHEGVWPPNIPFCLAFWDMDDTQGLPVNDHSAHGFTLYPVGSPTYEAPAQMGSDLFKAVPDVVNRPRMVSSAEAARTAQLIAEDNASQYLRASLTTGIDPRRCIGEVYRVRIVKSDGEVITDAKWAVDGWTMELRTGGTMSHNIRRVEAF